MQLPVLKTVVQQQDLRAELFDSHLSAPSAFPSDDDGNPRQAAGHEARFVAAFRRRQQHLPSVGHDRPVVFLLGAVSPVEQGYAVSFPLQPLGQHTGSRRLSRPADGNVAEADDDGVQPGLPFRMVRIGTVFFLDALPVQDGGTLQRAQHQPVPAMGGRAVHQIEKVRGKFRAQCHMLISDAYFLSTS